MICLSYYFPFCLEKPQRTNNNTPCCKGRSGWYCSFVWNVEVNPLAFFFFFTFFNLCSFFFTFFHFFFFFLLFFLFFFTFSFCRQTCLYTIVYVCVYVGSLARHWFARKPACIYVRVCVYVGSLARHWFARKPVCPCSIFVL